MTWTLVAQIAVLTLVAVVATFFIVGILSAGRRR